MIHLKRILQKKKKIMTIQKFQQVTMMMIQMTTKVQMTTMIQMIIQMMIQMRILQKRILMYHLLLLIQLLIQVVGRTMVSVVEQLLKKTMMMREKMIQIITHGFLKMMRKMNLKPMKHQLLIQQVQYH